MKAIYKTLIFGLIVLCISSCNDDSIFRGELYKKQIYIVSNTSNIFPIDISLDTLDTITHFSIACGGTEHIKQDVSVDFAYDSLAIPAYNKSNFDIDATKFAKWLNTKYYAIPSFKAVLLAQSADPYVTVPIVINPAKIVGKLSPDSTYFIPLKITGVSSETFSATKSKALCQIYFHNKYCSTLTQTYYNMKGTQQTGLTSTPSGVSTTKIYQPLTKNTVKTFVGTNTFSSVLVDILKNSMVVTIKSNDSLSVAPLDPTKLQVQLIAPPANNKDFLYTNFYDRTNKRFKIYYQYRFFNTTTNLWDTNWTYIQELSSRII